MVTFKTQAIVIFISLVIGFFISNLFFSNDKDAEKRIEQLDKDNKAKDKQIDSLEQKNRIAEKKMLQLDSILALDSAEIHKLKYSIKQDGVVVEHKIDSLKKLKPNEKVLWIINRYYPVSKH